MYYPKTDGKLVPDSDICYYLRVRLQSQIQITNAVGSTQHSLAQA